MSTHYGQNSHHPSSYYVATSHDGVACPTLNTDIEVDVCVIGAGYTGLSSALHLAESGCSVAVLEANCLAWGASGRNGGHVGTGQRRSQYDLEKLYGRDMATKLWRAGLDAVALVKSLIERYQIDCDLQAGILHVAHKARLTAHYQADAKLLEKHYGYNNARFLAREEVCEELGSDVFHGGLHEADALHLHPLNYALGIARAAHHAGARLYEGSRVSSYESDSCGVTVSTTNGCRVRAKQLVLGCNGYLDQLEPRISGKIMPINNFLVATEPLGQDMANSLVRGRLAVQDSRFVINYWRTSDDTRLIFGGGESYRSSLPSDIDSLVKKRITAIYPQLADAGIDYAWGGKLAITLNRMPQFGRLGSRIYFAHGYSGHGIPTATLAGKLIAEAIGSHSEQFELFAALPARTFPGGTLLRWPAMVAGMLYYSTLDRF
ncbi:NAD(P)/FAD-dependent oxidoreductase [Porticoccus sp.]